MVDRQELSDLLIYRLVIACSESLTIKYYYNQTIPMKRISDKNRTTTKSVMDITKQTVYVRKRRGKNIGDVEAVSTDKIVVKTGLKGARYYYVPIDKVEGWDGHVVCLNITEDEVKQFESKEKPDKSSYFTKDQGYGSEATYKDKKLSDKLPFIQVIERTD
jgi:hypothetical protein